MAIWMIHHRQWTRLLHQMYTPHFTILFSTCWTHRQRNRPSNLTGSRCTACATPASYSKAIIANMTKTLKFIFSVWKQTTIWETKCAENKRKMWNEFRSISKIPDYTALFVRLESSASSCLSSQVWFYWPSGDSSRGCWTPAEDFKAGH